MRFNIMIFDGGVETVIKCNKLIGTNLVPIRMDLRSVNNTNFDLHTTNIIVYDYTPVISGNIIIRYPGTEWKKLKLNSKLVHTIMSKIQFKQPHAMRRANILASIKLSHIQYIDITD